MRIGTDCLVFIAHRRSGPYNQEPAFYPFLLLRPVFGHFFIKPDEMFLENMRKASWAFYVSLLVVAGTCCLALFRQQRFTRCAELAGACMFPVVFPARNLFLNGRFHRCFND